MQRYSFFFIAMTVALVGGLYYGWVVNPVEGLQSSTEVLREDYQADYVLMVAEIYQSEQNPDLAIERLAFLNAENPLLLISLAQEFAQDQGYPARDKQFISELDAALRAWDPRLIETFTP